MQIILIGLLCLVAGCTSLTDTYPDIGGEMNSMTGASTVNISTTGSDDNGDTSGTSKGESDYVHIVYTLGTRSKDPKEMLEDYLRINMRLWNNERIYTSGSGDTFNKCFSIIPLNVSDNIMTDFYRKTNEEAVSIFTVYKKNHKCFSFDDTFSDQGISETGSQSGMFWITKNSVYQMSPDGIIAHRAKVAEKDPRPLYILKTKSNDPEELIKEYLGHYYRVPKGSLNRCFKVYRESDFGDIDKLYFITDIHETNIKAFTTWASDTGCGDLNDTVESAKLGNFIVAGTTVYDRSRGDTMGRVILAQKKQ